MVLFLFYFAKFASCLMKRSNSSMVEHHTPVEVSGSNPDYILFIFLNERRKEMENVIRKCRYETKVFFSRNSPTILTCLGVLGMVTTTVMAVRATPKAMQLLEKAEKEKETKLTKCEIIVTAGPAYIPATLIGVSAIVCVFGANILNKKQSASLASAYALLENSYREYREKLIELYGVEADQQIRDAIVRTNCDYHQIGCDIPDEKLIWHDEISGETFEAYEKEVMDAEYHLNRNFTMRGYASLNEFYEFMGLPQTEYGNAVGWSMSDGYCWIDFEHHLVSRDDGGTPIYTIWMVFPPSHDYLREWE